MKKKLKKHAKTKRLHSHRFMRIIPAAILLSIILFLFFRTGLITPSQVLAAIGVDSCCSTGAGSGSPIDVTHTVAGADRLMLVGISTDDNAVAVSSVVWDPTGTNQSLSLITGCTTSRVQGEIWIYQLVAPTTGTKTLRASFTGTGDKVVGVMTFTGVDQTTPLGTCAVANGDGGPATVNVTSATGELVFDTIASDENVTANASQTVRWDVVGTTTDGGASTKAGASTVTMSWTTGATGWAIGAVPIKPVSGPTPTPTPTATPTPTPTPTAAPGNFLIMFD